MPWTEQKLCENVTQPERTTDLKVWVTRNISTTRNGKLKLSLSGGVHCTRVHYSVSNTITWNGEKNHAKTLYCHKLRALLQCWDIAPISYVHHGEPVIYRYLSIIYLFTYLLVLTLLFGRGTNTRKWDMKQLKTETIAPTLLCHYKPRHIRALCGGKQM